MKLPNYIKAGDKITAEWANSILYYLRSITPRPSAMLPFDWTSDGIIFKPASVKAAAAAATLPPHNYTVQDASVGSTPAIRVTNGNHIDATTFPGGTYIPCIGSNPINVMTGTPPAYPTLTVGESDTLVWFEITIFAADGSGSGTAGAIDYTASPSISIRSGSVLPSNTNTKVYQLVANITVTTGATASVSSTEGGVSGSQAYQFCSGTAFGLQ